MKDLNRCTRRIWTRLVQRGTTEPAILAAEIAANLCYLYTKHINLYCS